jgi:hypothetical protein
MQNLLVFVDRVDRRYLPLVADGVVLPPGLTVDYLAWAGLLLGGLTTLWGQYTTQDAVGGGGSTGECSAAQYTAASGGAAASTCCCCCCRSLGVAAGAEGNSVRVQGRPLPVLCRETASKQGRWVGNRGVINRRSRDGV